MEIKLKVTEESIKSSCIRCASVGINVVKEVSYHRMSDSYVATEIRLPLGWVKLQKEMLLCGSCKHEYGANVVEFMEAKGSRMPARLRAAMLSRSDEDDED